LATRERLRDVLREDMENARQRALSGHQEGKK
jgi:hypothetical protein